MLLSQAALARQRLDLATALLEGGADPNLRQVLYCRRRLRGARVGTRASDYR